jgi:hypothetical protein
LRKKKAHLFLSQRAFHMQFLSDPYPSIYPVYPVYPVKKFEVSEPSACRAIVSATAGASFVNIDWWQ